MKGTSEMDLATLRKPSWYLHSTLQHYAGTWAGYRCAAFAAQMATASGSLAGPRVPVQTCAMSNVALKGSICAAGGKARRCVCEHHTACTGGSLSDTSGNKFWLLLIRLEHWYGTLWQKKRKHSFFFTKTKNFGVFLKNTNSRQWLKANLILNCSLFNRQWLLGFFIRKNYLFFFFF